MQLKIVAVWIALGFAALVKVSRQQIEVKGGEFEVINYGNFKEFLNHTLNVSQVLASIYVEDFVECAFECIATMGCFSFNIATVSSINPNNRVCHLLATDKYYNSSNFVQSQEFHHYAITSPCESFPCQNDGKCRTLYKENTYVCDCRAGFIGNHCEKDADECSTHSCDVNAACNNTLGSYTCSCKAGFTGDGRTCADIDECASRTHNCHSSWASCTNTPGSFRCSCDYPYPGDGRNCSQVGVYKNCAEVYQSGQRNSGVYKIDPDGLGTFQVFCDQKTAGGGWTMFQKRQDGSVDFYRGWDEYKKGFGNLELNGEFWLGLEKIHRLTANSNDKLRVDLEDINNKTSFAEYSSFDVASESSKYQLSLRSFSGTSGDSLSYHNGHSFTTKDRDNDNHGSYNCAQTYKGAWWYNSCYHSNLNGVFGRTNSEGMRWTKRPSSMSDVIKRSEMKIRPGGF